MPPYLLVDRFDRRQRSRLPRLFHSWVTRALGITTVIHGQPVQASGVLFVANHLSWADIPVLGSRIRGSFVAKHEVEGWGMVGWLADLQRTIYVERGRRTASGVQSGAVAERLAAGGNLILFPEGTSSDGVRPLPFKSSLFAAVEQPGMAGVTIQPVTIAYTRINGLPVTRKRLLEIAWIGDVGLTSHAVQFMNLGRVRAEIIFHEAVRAGDFPDRKALARHCHAVVADGYRRLMRE